MNLDCPIADAVIFAGRSQREIAFSLPVDARRRLLHAALPPRSNTFVDKVMKAAKRS
jgi:hypothetical protein